MSLQDDYASMLRSMLSPNWQKPSARKIEVILKTIEDGRRTEETADPLPSDHPSAANHRQLTALITASTKLATASHLVKEATVDVATTGLLPVEVQEEARKIAANLDEYIRRRITSTIEHIP